MHTKKIKYVVFSLLIYKTHNEYCKSCYFFCILFAIFECRNFAAFLLVLTYTGGITEFYLICTFISTKLAKILCAQK